MSNVYGWKSGSHIKANAQRAGEQFEQLSKSEDGLTPQSVLDANRAEGTPLHDSFEWDDTEAAEKYRLNQAGHFIRCITVSVQREEQEKPEAVRAYFTVTKGKYESTQDIIADAEKRDTLLEKALSEFNSYMKKYETLKELDPIRNAFIQVVSEVNSK